MRSCISAKPAVENCALRTDKANRKMKIENAKDAKQKARVVQRFFAEQDKVCTFNEALHLLARLEGLENWQSLSASLKPVAAAVVDPDGELTGYLTGVVRTQSLNSSQPDTWNIRVVTDRWGEVWGGCGRENRLELERDNDLYQRLLDQMWDEVTYIARKDGQWGVLFEGEFICAESEAGLDDALAATLPARLEVEADIKQDFSKVMRWFPEVQFCIPDPKEVAAHRPAVWAFVPDGALDVARRKALGHAVLWNKTGTTKYLFE